VSALSDGSYASDPEEILVGLSHLCSQSRRNAFDADQQDVANRPHFGVLLIYDPPSSGL